MASYKEHPPGLVPPSDDALIGRVIAGKFSLRNCIGVGASGTVYKADQTSLGRTVAVKVLRPELAVDPRFVRRFHDEALAASRLNHPNVVSIIDFGQTEDGLLYLVMEFLRGTTLTHVLRTEQLSSERITDIISQVLSALEEAHEAGVVHADLKSDNIMVEHRRGGWDLIKVVDFGIARLAGTPDEREEHDDSICGTPEYMAPEVIRGDEPTPSSDIYAVGIMLYELLVGYTPFTGGATIDVLKRHVNDAPIPATARETPGPVSEHLNRAAMRALAKTPEERFASVAEFGRYLRSSNSVATPIPETSFLCSECGTTSPESFKFCPECGAAQPERPGEFELALDDTGHDEIWSDDAPTADIVPGDLGSLLSSEMPSPSSTQELQAIALGPIFPLPLVGRERELEQVCAFMQGQSGYILHLKGELASGTSRILREAGERAAGGGSVVFLTTADPTGLATSFYPIRSIVAAILQLPPLCSYEDIGSSLEEVGLSLRDLPGIGELFQHEGGGLSQLEGPVRRRELCASTMRVLRAAGKHYSAVLAFEDYHLYDQPSQDLLRQLADGMQRSPAVHMLITSDLKCELKWPDLESIELGPLTDEDLRTLVSHLASLGHPDLVTIEELRTFSRGNPGHIHQLLRYATEGGDLRNAPESLADLIAARTDFLPSSGKRCLQAAAVFGLGVASEDLLETLANSIDRAEQRVALQELDEREMLRSESGLLSFSNAILRDVVYESTPVDVRRSLHEAAGDVLIATVSDPAILGMHAERAGSMARAAELLTRAGDNAVRQLDDAGAARIFNRALSATRSVLLAQEDSRAQLRLVAVSIKLADALRACGEVGLARGILAEATSGCHQAPILRAQLIRASAQLKGSEGDIEGAIALYREAISLAIPTLAIDILTDAYLDLATMQLRAGDPQTAIRELEEGIDLITMGEGPATKRAPKRFWRLLLRLSQLYASSENPEGALSVAQHAARLALDGKNAVGTARAHATLAGILEASGDSSRAQGYRRRAIDDMRRLGDRRTTAELLLAGSRPSQTLQRITPASVREARLLAEEIGWLEGVRKAQRVSGD